MQNKLVEIGRTEAIKEKGVFDRLESVQSATFSQDIPQSKMRITRRIIPIS